LRRYRRDYSRRPGARELRGQNPTWRVESTNEDQETRGSVMSVTQLGFATSHFDFPFWDALHRAADLIDKGATVHQTFTCATCHVRLTVEAENQFVRTATCEHCGKVTNIEARGCNFIAELDVGGGRQRRRHEIYRAPARH
jgi:hypothetical protein